MDDFDEGLITGISVAVSVMLFIIVASIGFMEPVILSDETALDICQQLTGQVDVNFEASSINGKLHCKAPSFDNTQNIIVEGGE